MEPASSHSKPRGPNVYSGATPQPLIPESKATGAAPESVPRLEESAENSRDDVARAGAAATLEVGVAEATPAPRIRMPSHDTQREKTGAEGEDVMPEG
jgi:hypothetical protein